MQGKEMTKQIDDKLHKNRSVRTDKATKYTNKTQQKQPNPQIHNMIYILYQANNLTDCYL